MAHVTIWEFLVPREAQPEFEVRYGPGGSWARLFRRSPDYLRTELVKDLTQPGRYLTLDYWANGDALHRFKAAHLQAYVELDHACAHLTEKESFLGDFAPLPPR